MIASFNLSRFVSKRKFLCSDYKSFLSTISMYAALSAQFYLTFKAQLCAWKVVFALSVNGFAEIEKPQLSHF